MARRRAPAKPGWPPPALRGRPSTIASFAQGGFTGQDPRLRIVPDAAGVWQVLREATGLAIGSSGKLQVEVAGLVHQNEYVIPEWMRADPQVLQVENRLEARRLKGYAQGGATTDGGSQATPAPAADLPADDPTRQLVQVLHALDQRLQGVEHWATQLEVVQDVLGLDREQEKVKQVKARGSLR